MAAQQSAGNESVQLAEDGYKASAPTVGKLLKERDYSLKANRTEPLADSNRPADSSSPSVSP